MKAWSSLVLAVLLALLTLGAAAQERALPAVGDELCGFRVTELAHNIQYDLDFVYMEHERTGARLVYIPCEDTNRCFSVAFRTPAESDKGIPHVFEHSTLGGSQKYPDPSLFFSMITQTYNTYLNAGTYISCTEFPSASLSEEQLLAFADFTMDGLYHPLIMTDERVMMREAYRYELTGEDAPLTLTGTVYSEMKAHANPLESSSVRFMKLLYPGSRFAAFNGGDPDHIPEMTWAELRDFHDRYYHPSNSLTMLYGKLDPVPFLALIDAEISAFDRREITLTDDAYTPISGYVEELATIPVSADSPEEAYIYYAVPLDGLTQRENDVLTLFASMYTVEGTPLYELFAAQMPHVTIAADMTSAPSPSLIFSVYGALPEEAEQVKALLREGLALTAEQGISGEKLRAAASASILSRVSQREASDIGVTLSAGICSMWGETGDVMAFADYDRCLGQVMELADAGLMQELAAGRLASPQTSAFGVYVTVPGALEEKNAAEQARLEQMKAAMTDEERAALIARTQDFDEWTQQNAAHSMIDAVKVVDAQSLPVEITRYESQESLQDGVRVIRADVDCDELVNVQLVFAADCIPYGQYDAFDAYIGVLGSIDTQNYTSEALQTAIASISTGMNIERTTVSTADGGFIPVVTLSWDCLPENIASCFELARELLLRADTTSTERARLSLLSTAQMLSLYISMDPSFVLGNVLPGYISDEKRFEALAFSGDRFTQYMGLGQSSDEELAALLENGQRMLLDVLHRGNLSLCAVGSAQSNDAAIAEGLRFAAELSDEPTAHYDYAPMMEELPRRLAFPVNADVGYNAMALSFEGTGYSRTGKLEAFASLVSDKVLLPELRFKRSCYGAYMQVGRTGVIIFTYRDPALSETFDVYGHLGDLVRGLELTQADIDGYIVNLFSWLSTPMGPMSGGKQAVSDRLNARDSFADKLEELSDVRQLTVQDVTEMAGLLDLIAEKGARMSISSPELIGPCSDMFDVIDPCFMFSVDAGSDMPSAEEETPDAA